MCIDEEWNEFLIHIETFHCTITSTTYRKVEVE